MRLLIEPSMKIQQLGCGEDKSPDLCSPFNSGQALVISLTRVDNGSDGI